MNKLRIMAALVLMVAVIISPVYAERFNNVVINSGGSLVFEDSTVKVKSMYSGGSIGWDADLTLVRKPSDNTIDANTFYLNASNLLTGTTGRTNAVSIVASRPDGSRFTTGGDDAGLKIATTNYNTTSQDSYYLRGLNVSAVNREGGSLGHLQNSISVTQKADSPVVTDLMALQLKVEEDSPNSTVPASIYGLNVIYDVVMASPATSAGIRAVNDSDTALADPTGAFFVDNTAADRQWQYGLYIDADTISTADIYLHNGDTLNNGAAGTITASGALAATTTVTGGTGLVATTGGVTVTAGNISLPGPLKVYSGTAATRAAVRAELGDTPAQGSIYISTGSVATTKPNFYVKVLNAGADTDWERIVSQASD